MGRALPGRRLLRRCVVPLLCASLLTACETQPLQQIQQKIQALQSGEPTPIVLDAPLPPAPERTWADAATDVNNNRISGWGLVNMPGMRVYLNGLYRRIKEMGGHPEWPGEVYVLADPSLKSTATAAGNIYLSLGWLQSMESEDEVFALLSHEFGHVYLGHHIIYDVTDAGDVASRVGRVAVGFARRASQKAAENGMLAVDMVSGFVGTNLVPIWKRSVEEEADNFGVVLSLRAGYSYPSGFKTVVERIATYDEEARVATEKLLAETERAQREAGGRAVLEQARRQQGNQKDYIGANESLNNLQLQLHDSVFDFSASINRTLTAAAKRAHETHEDATAREERLTQSVTPALAGRPRPAARTAPWIAVRKDPATAEILAHYSMTADAEDALTRNANAEALKLASVAASGRTANDAWPLYTLIRATQAVRPNAPTADLARRQATAPERSWRFELYAIREEAKRNRPAARTHLNQQFDYYQKAPAMWPEMIAYLRDNGSLEEARSMAQTCALRAGIYRASCLDSATTDAERQVAQAASERKAKEIVDKYGPKIK